MQEEEKEKLPESYLFDEFPVYKPISRLSDSMQESMRLMAEIQKLKTELPCIDCGSCGAPNCRAFAVDVVTKQAKLEDCLIRQHKLREGEDKK